MRKSAFALLAAILAPLAAHAQTAQDLINSGKNTENVLTYGMGYDLQRYSTLLQVDTATSSTWSRSGTTVSTTTAARNRSRW